MRRLREFLGLTAPLEGLEELLGQVADGHLPVDDAARRIRRLASQPHIPPWFLRVFRIMGALFAMIGLGFGVYSAVFAIGAEEVQGTVVKMVGDTGQSPVVEYEVKGRKFTYQSPLSSSPPAYCVGERISVLYHPNDPAKAQINSGSSPK
jgi:hypothetical protein